MAKAVGNVLVEMSANIANFEQGVGRATSLLNSSAVQMNSALGTIEKRLTNFNTAGGAFITGWIVKMGVDAVKSSLAFGASVKELSENLGLSTNAAQEFEFALQKGGTTAEQATTALETFTKTVGEAREGSQSAQEALARLSITTDDLRAKNMEGLFSQAADALSKFGNVADRNAAAIGAFGKAATSNGDALAISADKMREFRTEAETTGAVMDKVLVERAKELQVQLEATSQRLKVTFSEALISLGPTLIWFGKLVANTADMLRGLAEDAHLLSATGTEREYDALLRERLNLVSEIAGISSRRDLAGNRDLSAQLEQDNARLKEIDGRLSSLRTKYQAIAKAGPDPASATAPAGPTKGTLFVSKEAQAAIDDLVKKRAQAEEAMTTDAAEKAQMRMNTDVAEVQAKLRGLSLWVDAGKRATGEQQKAMDAYYAWLKERQEQAARDAETPMQKMFRDWRNVSAQMQEASANWVKSTSDAFSELVLTGKADFKSLFESILSDLVHIQMQKVFAELFPAKGTGAGSSTGSVISAIGSWFGGAHASGGDFAAGRPILVGEQGPELIFPSGAGQVIANSRLRGGGAGDTHIHLGMTVQTGVAATVRAEIADMMPRIADAVKTRVVDERARGGRMGQALR